MGRLRPCRSERYSTCTLGMHYRHAVEYRTSTFMEAMGGRLCFNPVDRHTSIPEIQESNCKQIERRTKGKCPS